MRKPFEAGDIVWHGTSSEIAFENLDLVSWVSDSETVADYFVDWHEEGFPRIIEYSFIGSPLLAYIESDEEWENLISWVAVEKGLYGDWQGGLGPLQRGGTQDIADALCDVGLDGWHHPYNYPSGSDTMLCEPEKWLKLIKIHEQDY